MALNPVEQRLVELQGLWQDFLADAGRRLLLWQVPDNARRLLHAFFEAQRHDMPGGAPAGSRVVTFDKAWRSARKRAAVPGKILHDFRRTAVRNLVRAGVSESVAMQEDLRPILDRERAGPA